MNVKKGMTVLICASMLVFASGCAEAEKGGAKTAASQNSVENVLQQGIAEAENASVEEIPAAEGTETTDTPDIGETSGEEEISQTEMISEIAQILEEAQIPEDPQVPEDAGNPAAEEDPAAEGSPEEEVPDVDLTVLSSTMVYSEVYNMMVSPDSYIGKTIKMNGLYFRYHDESTGKDYYSCIITDATACCSQGIEFILTEEYAYPDDYPEEGDEICVIGTFDTYSENGYLYCTLRNARLA